MAQRRKKASSKPRSPSPRQREESPRQLLKREREQRKEALERERATSEILRVIAESQTDVQPVFDTIVRNAVRLCRGMFANAFRYDGEQLHLLATTHKSVKALKSLADRYPMRPHERQASGRAILAKATVKIEDALADPAYDHRVAVTGSWRRALAVPMLRGGEPIGVISVSWPKPGPVSERQEQLLKTFADQAVIAIENVRLFNETKEALEHQRASGAILRVISSSVDDTQPVFDAIVSSCAQLFPGYQIGINVVDDRGELHVRASVGLQQDALEKLFRDLAAKYPGGGLMLRGKVAHFPDTEAPDVPPPVREGCRVGGTRAVVFAAMVVKGKGIGALWIARVSPGAFSAKEIALLQTFADQAVIAIENVRLFNETKEALERQTATADILKVISASPTDVQPVFEAVAQRAAQLCNAANASVWIAEGTVLRRVAAFGHSMLLTERPAHRTWINGRAFLDLRTVHVEDLVEMLDEYPESREDQQKLGVRTMIAVPMIREGKAVGTIGVWRREVKPFSKTEIELLETFAAQAVIAIENARLFNETKEALERQTASAEILQIISRSPTDVQPVLDAVAASAAQLCGAIDAIVMRVDGNEMRRAAHFGTIPSTSERRPITSDTPSGRAIVEGRVIHVADICEAFACGEYLEARALQRASGFRTVVSVPLMREEIVVGVITIRRLEVRPFGDNEIALLKTFADQAVIAIENVRLFNETKEALERQTATGEILKVISGSQTDVQPVFDAIVQNGARLFAPCNAVMIMREGDLLYRKARAGPTTIDTQEVERLFPAPYSPGSSPNSTAIAERRMVVIEDAFASDQPEIVGKVARAGNWRTSIIIPLVRENEGIGTLALTHPQPNFSLSEKQIALLRTFADQAVIAIENVRLFKELQARTDALTKSVGQLTALGEVGQAISSTLDLETVLKTIVSRAVQLTGLDAGAIYEYDEPSEQFYLRAAERISGEAVEALRAAPIRKGDGAVGGTAVAREPIQIAETQDDSYKSQFRDLILRTGRRALLAVPLMHEEHIVGALAVHRNTPGPFTAEVVDLLKTFAAQSALAIQNAKLFREIQEKSAQLEVANKHKSDFLANMSHELRTPLNAIIGFSEALIERMFGDLNDKQLEYQKDILESGKHLLSLINDILDLSKIEAGRMELELSSFHLPSAISNAITLIRERAMRHGIALGVDIDERLGEFQADERKVKQVLLNLLSNAVKFTPDGGRVDVSAKLNTDKVEIAVKDTGVGIAPEDQASLFEEFKQLGKDSSRKAEGTGLGLALTKRLVELHGGQIRVDSAVGSGSTFRVMLPFPTVRPSPSSAG